MRHRERRPLHVCNVRLCVCCNNILVKVRQGVLYVSASTDTAVACEIDTGGHHCSRAARGGVLCAHVQREAVRLWQQHTCAKCICVCIDGKVGFPPHQIILESVVRGHQCVCMRVVRGAVLVCMRWLWWHWLPVMHHCFGPHMLQMMLSGCCGHLLL